MLSQYTAGTNLGGLSVSPDGTHLAVVERYPGSSGSTFFEINLGDGAITPHSVAGTSGPFYDISYLANGTVLISQQSTGNGAAPVRIYDFATGQFTAISAPGDAAMAILTASADYSHVLLEPYSGAGTYIYMSGVGFVAQVLQPPFDPYAGAGLPQQGGLRAQAISPDGTLYVRGSDVFDASLNLVASLATSFPYADGRGATFSADGQTLFLSVGSSVVAFSTSTWQVQGAYDAGGTIPYPGDSWGAFVGYGDMVQASPDGQHLSVITSTGIKLIDLLVATFESTNGADAITGEGLLLGLGGNDELSGIGTLAAMYGGAGNDTYHVTGYSDTAYEVANEGQDTVHSIVGYTLGAIVVGVVVYVAYNVLTGT